MWIFHFFMSEPAKSQHVTAVPQGVDGAVGVGSSHWYVGMVNSRHEKSASDKLSSLGIENYVATQEEVRIWSNGRRRRLQRVVIPGIVFIRCTDRERRDIVQLPYINRFMVNRSVETGGLNKPVAVIPDRQLHRLQYMLGHSDSPVTFEPTVYRIHDNVRVIRGRLQGLEGEIMRHSDGSHTLTISIAQLGGATVHIDPHDVEKLSQ